MHLSPLLLAALLALYTYATPISLANLNITTPPGTPPKQWSQLHRRAPVEIQESPLDFCFPPVSKKALAVVEKAKPKLNLNVFVFYGRRQNTAVLERYLRRNSIANGGLVTKVLFVLNLNKIKDNDDVDWINALAAKYPDFYEVTHTPPGDFNQNYAHITAKEDMYIKVDDDVVFILDGTFEAMVAELWTRRDWYLLSANVVGHTIFNGIHNRFGALRAWTLNTENSGIVTKPANETNWRVSHLPHVNVLKIKRIKTERDMPGSFYQRSYMKVDQEKGQEGLLKGSPLWLMKEGSFDACSWKSAHCAGAVHYSFFEAVEQNNTERYFFPTWDLHSSGYQRWSIHMFAFWGKDVMGLDIAGDDEQYLTVTYPEKVERHSGAVGNGLIAHLGYFTQEAVRTHTDVLDKYDALSREIEQTKLHGMACPGTF
ncbi:hypothetical protein HDU79_002982 [Rhizoclosmatium sp. JEL0117]|nr:hypothetical protein HDU79_002982 [Rhizoclosmatium sp. JEL0117]